jgi:hypothetical protein
MGYKMNMKECKIMIKHENQNCALNALKEFTKDKQFAWVYSDVIQKCTNLEEALAEMRYQATFDEAGNIVDLEFTGEKLGDDTKLFNCIAPFVEDGSYIEMVGEDGDTWRWVFNNEICEKVYPSISW